MDRHTEAARAGARLLWVRDAKTERHINLFTRVFVIGSIVVVLLLLYLLFISSSFSLPPSSPSR